jgi:hypothetical protein
MRTRNLKKTVVPPFSIATAVVVVVILSLATPHLRSAVQSVPANPPPLWTIDLAQYGYQGRPPIKLSNADTWGGATYYQGVAFTDANTLAVYFVTHDDPPGAPSDRAPAPTDPYHLIAIFLNLTTHEVVKKQSWITPGNAQHVAPANFFPVAAGGYIVRYGDLLALYSPSFKCVSYRKIGYGIGIMASPAGDTLLLESTTQAGGFWNTKFELVNTDQLATIKSWSTETLQKPEALWGEQIIMTGRNRADLTRQSITIQNVDAVQQPFTALPRANGAVFLDRNTLAGSIDDNGRSDVVVVSLDDGKILRRFDLGLEQLDGPIVGSRDGQRYAIPTMRWGVARHNNPDVVRARVFSLDREAPILTIDVALHTNGGPDFFSPEGDSRFGAGGLALSADGLLLAVKSGGIVQLYSLPAPGSLPPVEAAKSAEPPARAPTPQASYAVPAQPPSPLVEQALSWLPSDTESVVAANGPFPFPDLRADDDDTPDNASSAQSATPPNEAAETQDRFRSLPLSLFGMFGSKNSPLGPSSFHANVLLAIEGARHFGPPHGLGIGLYQGCDMAILDHDITTDADAILKSAATKIVKTEKIEGYQVTVFREKLEEDTWTTYVTFPKPNIVIVATDEAYLREVLLRISGKTGPRALPATLPEWKYADTHAEFWTLRHFDRGGMKTDPSSPFWDENSQTVADKRAIGFTFKFDPATSKTASFVYLSDDKDVRPAVEKFFSAFSAEPGAREMNTRYRALAPGVIEVSEDLDHYESAILSMLVLLALVGHPVYL